MNKRFEICSKYKPSGDQPKAIQQLTEGLIKGYDTQTLLGITGSGKTYTIANVIEQDTKTTKKIIRKMMLRYEEEDRGIRILELEDSFQMCTKKEMYEYLIQIAKQPKRYHLTDVVLETLSIVAYKQPVTRLEIENFRGVNSDYAVNALVENNLIEIVGRKDAVGKPLLYGTTDNFLRCFFGKSIEG